MISNVSPEAAVFMNGIDRIQNNIAQASQQVSSGLQISVASDAPDQIGYLLQLRANRLHNTQVQSNLTLAQTDAQSADDALSSSIQLLDTATTLATQGATATATATSRASMAEQVQSILQQMVANSQTNVQGAFIFSGDQDQTPQYTWDATQANPVVTQQTSSSTRLVENPAGGTFQASLTAQHIFDDRDPATGNPATDNVFNALNTLVTALNNNDTAGISSSVSLLQAASVHLNTAQSFYGNLEDQIQGANTYASNYDIQLQTEISNIQDADVARAASELTEANTQLQASMQMQGQMPHSSLFNYLG
ncbi:MAG TPA: flagellin [Bryobacteraceae bacterium]|jgi:flagellar hook-associated protein 3 FlgL|nr:flagellin [Bryobacteraceae bacterium]